MTRSQLDALLIETLAGMGISRPELPDQTHFSHDLGLDSLDLTDLIIQVEHQCGIRIPDEDWWALQTLGALKTYFINQAV